LQIGADLYDAFATAQGLQRYDYLGSVPTIYTLSFVLEGSLALTIADAASPTGISGGFTVFGSDFHPEGETHGTVLGSDFVSEHARFAGVTPFSLPGGFSFAVNPGDSFYVQAQMTAVSITNVEHQADGTVDALHTMAGTSPAATSRCSLPPPSRPCPRSRHCQFWLPVCWPWPGGSAGASAEEQWRLGALSCLGARMRGQGGPRHRRRGPGLTAWVLADLRPGFALALIAAFGLGSGRASAVATSSL
jgi:hypothetical protein